MQYFKNLRNKNKFILILKEKKDPGINKCLCNIIPDLLNLICSYLPKEFDPVESLKLSQINPKIYPYEQYIQDLLNYKIKVFDKCYQEIEQKFSILKSDTITNAKEPVYFLALNSMWARDRLNHLINQFNKYNLEIPIQNIIRHRDNNVILRVEINSQEYNISIKKNKLKINGVGLQYELLSFFWKLVYRIIYLVLNFVDSISWNLIP